VSVKRHPDKSIVCMFADCQDAEREYSNRRLGIRQVRTRANGSGCKSMVIKLGALVDSVEDECFVFGNRLICGNILLKYFVLTKLTVPTIPFGLQSYCRAWSPGFGSKVLHRTS